MILRLSEKLRAKLKTGASSTLPRDKNALADWSASLFVANRTQYILLSNTASFYSTVFFAKGATSNDGQLITFALKHLREFMEADGLLHAYLEHIAPSSQKVQFAKAFSRGVTGTMNELIWAATNDLVNYDMSPHDVGLGLNNLLFSSIASNPTEKYGRPRDVFQKLMLELPN